MLGRPRFPDPVVTANVYCSGRLDEVIVEAMVPFRDRLRETDAERAADLWLARYAKGGEHLKVRVHGPQELAEPAAALLRDSVEPALARIGQRPEGEERLSRPAAPPIDAEDRAAEDHPDRSLLFTRYGRSHVTLGGEPLLSDDEYRARMTGCLARGSDLVLDAFAEQGVPGHGQRQRLLLKALIAGIGALGFPLEKGASYLAYHRDWLVRFPLLKRGAEPEEAQETLARLEQRAAKAAATVATLADTVAGVWVERTAAGDAADAEVADNDGGTPWGTALAALAAYVSRFRDEPDYRLDPFAPDVVFNPVFKAYHNLANQLGLKMLDEAFAHHLLLRAAAPDDPRYRRIALTPE